jgi:hypothetical protein
VRIDDEHGLHEQLEAAFGAIAPRPAPVDGAVRRGRAIRVRRRVAAAAGAAAVAAVGVFGVPSLLHSSAAGPGLGPVAPVGRYTVTVQAPGPNSAPGLIALGTINGQGWQFTAARSAADAPGHGAQFFMTSGPAFGGDAGSLSGPALAVYSGIPDYFSALTCGAVQVQYGAVGADVTYVAVRLGNGTVLILHPVAVYGVRAVAFAIPVGAAVVEATAYSRHGEIATAIPFNAPNGVAAFGVWLKPGQHGLTRASGLIGSGTFHGSTWSVTAYLGPWGMCIQVPAIGNTSAACTPTTAALYSGALEMTGGELTVAAGYVPASTAWVIVNQPYGTTTKVYPVTVGGQKLFAVLVQTGPGGLTWTAYDSSGHVVRWPTG